MSVKQNKKSTTFKTSSIITLYIFTIRKKSSSLGTKLQRSVVLVASYIQSVQYGS